MNRTVGRLFFTAPGVGDGSCTATVVDSPSGSTVVTAAHCLSTFLSEDKPDVWNTNVYFVPGYLDDAKPRGGFTARASLLTDGYFTHHRSTEDFAMLVMNKAPDGRPIAEVTGSQRIAFNAKRNFGQPTYAFGYSAAMWNDKPWDMGQLLGYSSGKAKSFNDQHLRNQWGVRSDQSGGSSGGPHLTGFNPATATGTVVGVTSQGGYLPDDPDYNNRYSIAANLDTTAQTLYNHAQKPRP
ncbi:trypsin-like serine peptidase [Streptomyces lavendulae]|uniref:trypsin-like serine peptidase n=1 Tax=Streptomyces lavendulae TaxID=1914 RepID=UPI0033FF311E